MLHLLVCRDRVTLSDRLMEEVCHQASNGVSGLIMIVPEQFSHETEHRLCRSGGDTISRYAEVLSPSRLADRVFAAHGGISRAYLDQGGRLLAMAVAAEQCASRMKLYGSMLRRPEFLVEMISIVDEFQSYCIDPAMLSRVSAETEGLFAQKLEELSLLYEAYLAVCANGKADPAGKLASLSEVLQMNDWAKERHFFIDGFLDFSGAEFLVLEQLICQSKHVWITIPSNGCLSSDLGSTQETMRQIKKLAQKCEVLVEVIELEEHCGRDSALSGFIDQLFSNNQEQMISSDRIVLKHFQTVEEECRNAVLQAKLLLSQGCRCREIALASADPDVYEVPLRASIRMAGLPAYYAGKEHILSKPILNSLLSALQAAVGPMDYEDMALFLKSGLPLMDRSRCDKLDAYAYLWNLFGSQWEKPWELHPRGFGEEFTDEDRDKLVALNEDKNAVFAPIFHLRQSLFSSKNTGEMVISIYDFLEELQIRERLEEQANKMGGQQGQELVQLHEIICQSLEQTWFILKDTVRSPDDFVKLYQTVLTQYHVGTIPAGLDQIYVGSVQDLRSMRVDHLLVLGANDGVFPSYRTADGLLTEEERKTLSGKGINLALSKADQMEREITQIHGAFSAAIKSVWISCSGEQPAWLFRRAVAICPQSLNQSVDEIFLNTPSFAAWRLRHSIQTPTEIPDIDQIENTLKSLRDYSFTPLNEKTVNGLYGRQISLSASRIDKYAACRFAFFLAYGLKAQPTRQAKLDPSTFGTFVHAVLEETVIRVKSEGGFRVISQERLLEIALEEIERYVEVHFPKQAQRESYLFQRSKSEILDIVLDMGQELQNSLFQPVDCELEFSLRGDLPPIEVQGNTSSCKISGFVDRVDLYQHEGKTYVRVVDYKTGRKDFDFTDILNGAGLQMLIYLFALQNAGGSYYHVDHLNPAGVLYLPVRKDYTLTPPAPDDEFVFSRHQEERRRKGLISSDPAILAAMEADPDNPQYMPYQRGKNGLSGNLADFRQMRLLEKHVLRTLSNMTDQIASGTVLPNPIFRGQDCSCRFCDYKTICHRDLCAAEIRNMASTTAEKFWQKLEQEDEHG